MRGVEAFFSSGDGWAELWVLDVELIESLRFGPPAGRTDLEVAVALTRLLEYDFGRRRKQKAGAGRPEMLQRPDTGTTTAMPGRRRP